MKGGGLTGLGVPPRYKEVRNIAISAREFVSDAVCLL